VIVCQFFSDVSINQLQFGHDVYFYPSKKQQKKGKNNNDIVIQKLKKDKLNNLI